MKSKMFVFLALLIVSAMVFTACSTATEEAAPAEEAAAEEAAPAAEPIKVIHLVNGNLGDKSFFDSAERGVKQASEDYGFTYKTIEMGTDPAA